MSAPIVVGFDGSDHGRDALALGRSLAEALATHLIVVIAYTPEERLWAPGTAEPLDAAGLERIKEAATAALSGFDALEFREAAWPSAAAVVHREAEHEEAQMIVVGSSHRSLVGRVLLGSVAHSILTAAPCPVALAPAGLAAKGVRFGRIGVAFDDTAEAFDALEAARGLARVAGAQLSVMWAAHLVERTLPFAAVSYARPNYFKEIRAELEGRLAAATAPIAAEMDVRTELLSGPTVDALVSRSEHLDLLVVGSRGFGPVRRVLLGSTSFGLLGEARCPVLVVPRGTRAHDAGEPTAAAHAAIA